MKNYIKKAIYLNALTLIAICNITVATMEYGHSYHIPLANMHDEEILRSGLASADKPAPSLVQQQAAGDKTPGAMFYSAASATPE
jgi:hypothetical protein